MDGRGIGVQWMDCRYYKKKIVYTVTVGYTLDIIRHKYSNSWYTANQGYLNMNSVNENGQQH